MRNGWIPTIALALAAIFLVAGCSGEPLSEREKGTGVGALVGAGTGAIIGAAVGGLGAAGGFAVGNEMQNQNAQNQQTQGQIEQQQQEIEQQRQQIEQMKQEQETE
jgi:phage tail tape-measure protein